MTTDEPIPAPPPETMTAEQLVELASGTDDTVEVDAATLRELWGRHPDHPVYGAALKAWATRKKPLRIARVTLRELLGLQ